MFLNLIVQATNLFGEISPPPGVNQYGEVSSGGLIKFSNNILKLIIVGGGIFTFINFLLAGFGFMTAGGDPKKITQSVDKIWQSVLGLVIMAGSFVAAAIIGWIVFGDVTAILNPKIYGPQ